MRIIPEYEPVDRLYMSFVNSFFHSRFNYGRTICDIAREVPGDVTVEIFVAEDEKPLLLKILAENGLSEDEMVLNPNSPLRGIIAEYFPVFCRDEQGRGTGLHFRNDKLDLADYLHRFSGDLIDSLGFRTMRMEESFATARVSVNEDLCLISEEKSHSAAAEARLEFFRNSFTSQRFIPVPPLTGDHTGDLDMYLWPVRPKVWLVSQYPDGTPQEISVRPAIEAIRNHGHEALMIPGLPRIKYDDVNTMPNYANGILLNGKALCPSYSRPEDEVVPGLLEKLGYEAVPVDCRRIIESNSGLHCISKTLPSFIL